ncbi:MAG TPA: DinB family protein [Chitinophagaceae bacterium]|nr:DinB family protein [Chitinophagaceae bacterium]
MSALVETWHISHRINEYLLSGIQEPHLADISLAKGRSVGHQFAHMHNVRLMWVQASAPDLLPGLQKIDKEIIITKKVLLDAFEISSEVIAEILKRGIETAKVKGFKPTPEAFLGYMISHESYHRGQIVLALKENGHLPDKKILYGMWEWGVR